MFIFDIYHIEKGELWGGLHLTRNTQKTAHDTQNMCVIHLWLHFYMLAFRMKCVPCSVFMKRVDTVGYKGNVYNGNSSHRYIFHSLNLVIAIGIFRASWLAWNLGFERLKSKPTKNGVGHPKLPVSIWNAFIQNFIQSGKQLKKYLKEADHSLKIITILRNRPKYLQLRIQLTFHVHFDAYKDRTKKNPASEIYIICAYLLLSIARIFL